MIANAVQQPASPTPPSKDIFLARQPILNRSQMLVAYELLVSHSIPDQVGNIGNSSVVAEVLACISALDLEIVIGDSVGYLGVDSFFLMSDAIQCLPQKKILLEIPESIEATPEVIARLIELRQSGFKFALNSVVANTDNLQKLLPFMDVVKIDVQQVSRENLPSLCRLCKTANTALLAKKVEHIEQFQLCRDLGFDYFQGYYFARPLVIGGKKIAPSELAVMHLIDLINIDADHIELERCIKRDASIGLGLLRIVNTPASGAHQRIGSLNQALMMLGRTHLQRWLQILLYAKAGRGAPHPSPLLLLASTRGKFLELMAQKIRPGNRNIADIGFTVGIMSLMDTLFGVPMEHILTQVAVIDEVSEALLYRKGFYGDMLKVAEYIERLDESRTLLAATLSALQLAADDFYMLELAAFEWVNKISSGEDE